MMGSGTAMWQICCTTNCRIIVSSSVGGVVQHVRSRCPFSGVWHLPVEPAIGIIYDSTYGDSAKILINVKVDFKFEKQAKLPRLHLSPLLPRTSPKRYFHRLCSHTCLIHSIEGSGSFSFRYTIQKRDSYHQ